jgi:hypothetical protein
MKLALMNGVLSARMVKVWASITPSWREPPEKNMPSGPARANSARAPNTVATAMVRKPCERASRSSARLPSWDALVIRLNRTVARDRAMMECGSRYSWLATSSTALPGSISAVGSPACFRRIRSAPGWSRCA